MADWKKLLDSAVSGAKAAGEGIRQAADDARKVVGIGVGEMTIALVHRAYRGETLHGTVKLELPEPIAARCLMIALRARRTRIPVENLRDAQASPFETEDVFDLAVEVADEQTFHSGTFPFAIDVPDEVADVELEGLLGEALRAARALKSLTHGELRWRLEAWLEIPWKRNLSKKRRIAVNEKRPRPTTAAAPPPPPRPPPSPPPIPRPVSLPTGWTDGLDTCLRDLQRRGWIVIHHHVRPSVDPAVVMEVLGRHPDLDPELLQFYGVMDGMEIMVGRPLAAAPDYEVVRIAAERAARRDGWLGECYDPYSGPLGDALVAELHEDSLRVLEIPSLADLIDETSEHFSMTDSRQEIYGAVVLGYGDYFGLVRADTIRGWQHARDDDERQYVMCGESYGAALQAREREHTTTRWWAVRGDDHGAGLAEPPQLLRWSELLGACLDHLAGR